MASNRTRAFLFFLLVVAVLTGLNYVYQPFLKSDSQTLATASPNPTPTDLNSGPDLTQFTARQKVTWLLAVPVTLVEDQPVSASTSAWLTQNRPGAITIFGSRLSAEYVTAQIGELESAMGSQQPKPLIAIDHEGGQVQRLTGQGFTILPSWQNLCARPATQSAQLLQASAREIRQAGIDLVFAPMTDLATAHPVLKNRICDSDPEVVIERSQAYIDAMAAEQVRPVIKHFPGIGQTTKDLHLQFDQVTVTTEEAQIYQSLLNTYPTMGVMVSHVGVTNQFSDVPCSLSADCVGQLSANFPDALIVSDALEMKAASYLPASSDELTLPVVAEKAVRAGDQLLVFGPQVSLADLTAVIMHLEAKYGTDPAFKAQVDRAVVALDRVPNL